MAYVASPEELRNEGKHEWDIDSCYAVEEERLAGDLRNTVARRLCLGQPGVEERYRTARGDEVVAAEVTSFFDDYCRRGGEPVRNELIDQGKGEIRGTSPRKEVVSWWRRLFWIFAAVASQFFYLFSQREEGQNKILICAFFLLLGSWLIGHGFAKRRVKNHIEHPSNNLLFIIDENNVNRRKSNITSFEIWIFIILGTAIYGLSFWLMVRSLEDPLPLSCVAVYAGATITLAESVHCYKKEIRQRLLTLMFTAQTMFAAAKHMQFINPDDISDENPFVVKYKSELDLQFSKVTSRVK